MSEVCSIEGCTKPLSCKGWCTMHYCRWRRHGDPLFVQQKKSKQICKINGCDKLSVSRGLCSGHYHKLLRYGDPVYNPYEHRSRKKCKINGCDRISFSLGLCSRHYQINRWEASHERIHAVHGIYKEHPYEARSYYAMRRRCYSAANPSYPRYGGSDITVCDRWLGAHGFQHFVEDMGDRPKGFTLDRIDNKKGYSPDNCRWSSVQEQNRNRKTNIFYTHNGKTRVLIDWAREYGLRPSLIYRRYQKGLREEKLFAPPRKRKTY